MFPHTGHETGPEGPHGLHLKVATEGPDQVRLQASASLSLQTFLSGILEPVYQHVGWEDSDPQDHHEMYVSSRSLHVHNLTVRRVGKHVLF